MGYFDRLRAMFSSSSSSGGADSSPADERSPLEQSLIKDLQARLDNPETAERLVRFHMRFTGQVQGVGFRWNNQGIAGDLKLAGWVINCSDGSVEMELQGTPGKLIRHLDQLHSGYRRMRCRIWLSELDEMDADPADTEFEVRMSPY